MDKELLKKTFKRSLQWEPLVLVIMAVLASALIAAGMDFWAVIGFAAVGCIIGPLLEAVFYYSDQKKQAQTTRQTSVSGPAERLRDATSLFKEGLIQEAEFEHIRKLILDELATGHQSTPTVTIPENSTNAKPSTSAEPAPVMAINPWLAIAVALSWPVMGFGLVFVLEKIFRADISVLNTALFNLVFGAFGAFYLFPTLYRAPFGKISLREYLKRLGFYLPTQAWKHLLLGLCLAIFTLSGMLAASVLIGRYQFDPGTVNLSHLVFSLNPGIWEEFFYRGIMMMLLLPLTKSVKKAALLQIILFALAHIKGTDLLAFVDAFSVGILALGSTYVAYKTRSLLAGIIFHFVHDAFVFAVQLPEGIYSGFYENILFYGILWAMIGLGCLLTWFAVEHLKVQETTELYVTNAI